MCVAIPGIVISQESGTATVDFNGNKIKALTGLVEVNVSDYVVVHAGCIIQVLKDREAQDLIELMKEMDDNDEVK